VNRRSLGFARDDKKERVIARRGRLLKEKASPGPNEYPVSSQAAHYEDENVSVQ
jgi:hypothetical protein